MGYDAAKVVLEEVQSLTKHDPNIILVGIENVTGDFGILVGALQPEDVDLPNHIDNVVIRVIQQDMPSAFEPPD